MKQEAIEEHRYQFSVRKMCRALGVKESTIIGGEAYRNASRKTAGEKKRLVMKTDTLFSKSRKTCGYRKMQRALAHSGTEISVYRGTEEDEGERL